MLSLTSTMVRKIFIKAWTCKRKIAPLLGIVSVVLLAASSLKSPSAKSGKERRGIKAAEFAGDGEAETPDHTPASAIAVKLENETEEESLSDLTITAEFIGIEGVLPVFADIDVFKAGKRFASYRTPIGKSFEVPVAGNQWLRIEVRAIDLPAMQGSVLSDSPQLPVVAEQLQRPSVLIHLTRKQEHP